MTHKSIFRWAGSKAKIVGKLAEFWRSSGAEGTYIEPFAGSACLFFHTQPTQAKLNDINEELINAMRVLCSNPQELHENVVGIPVTKEEYLELRSLDPGLMSKFDRAVRFVYLNRYCFNGLWRTNKKGQFNVPFGGGKSGSLPPVDRFLDCAKMLERAELHSQDFEKFLQANVRKGDFIYVDPPYAVSNRRVFSQYSPNTFGLNDIKRLTNQLELIDKKGAYFLVSYAVSPELKEIADGWPVIVSDIQRNIAGFAKHRRVEKEAFVSNIIYDRVKANV